MNLKKGRSNVIEPNYTLILGFGERVLEIIRKLIIANESEKDKAIVVLAEKDKTEYTALPNHPSLVFAQTERKSFSTPILLSRLGIMMKRY